MSELNVLQQIALSYAILQTGRKDLTIDHLVDRYNDSGIEVDEELVDEFFESDVISHTITDVIGWYGERVSYSRGDEADQKWVKDNGLVLLDQDGGGEGGAEYCYSVFSWQEKIYKVEYSYYSYDGYNCEDAEQTIREVKPVEKLITVYE